MRIKITGRNIELTEGLKAAVEDKLNKLEKYFTPDTDICDAERGEGETESRGYNPGKRKLYPLRAGKQRYVCIH